MKQVDFFYFFGSGYAYLSVMRIEPWPMRLVSPCVGGPLMSALS
jgi:hypothetical protein